MRSTSYMLILILMGALLMGGNTEKTAADRMPVRSVLSNGEVTTDLLSFKQGEGRMYYKNVLFTGVSVAYSFNGEVSEKIAYVNGERHGYRQKRFANGKLSYEAIYESNKLNGTVRSWWSNGNLRSESNYVEGKLHGVQKQWYATGQLFKELHMVDGKEEGMQRAWRKNGKIYVNYEAKNGRVFGLKRAGLCYELNDETIVYNE